MNKYEVLGKIGEGEYGEVLKARNKDNDQVVAIKKFKQDDHDEDAKRVILREVKILKMMQHENVTEFKDAFRKKGRVYLVCQFVERNLLQIIDQTRGIDRERIREYLYQILKGLAYMHSSGLIHRDIKPQNVLINSDHSLKLCDFGFARAFPPYSGEMTDYVATRWYRPPELLLGIPTYDLSVDVWAVGCLFGEMLDGEAMFPGQTQIDMLYLIQKLIGPMSEDQQQFFYKNPKFIGMKFPEISSNDSLERRYSAKIGKEGIDLMRKILRMDPKQRLTAAQALRHPYFARVKPRATESPLNTEFAFQKPKNSAPNHSNSREKPHISMLGINKIKGILQQTAPEEAPTKSKIIINVHNIQSKQSSNNSVPKNDGKGFQAKKQQLNPKKKPRNDCYAQNYVQQFDQQQFQEAPNTNLNCSKGREITRNRRRDNYQDQMQERVPPRTPGLSKIKAKKKFSKYDGDQDNTYDGPNLAFPRRRDRESVEDPNQNIYSIVLNNNIFNYNQRL